MRRQHLALVFEKIGHDQDARLRSRLPQHTAFFDVRYRQPARAFRLERMRDGHRAVAIRIGLHHRHHFDGLAHQGLHGAKVGANLSQRYFYPAPHLL